MAGSPEFPVETMSLTLNTGVKGMKLGPLKINIPLQIKVLEALNALPFFTFIIPISLGSPLVAASTCCRAMVTSSGYVPVVVSFRDNAFLTFWAYEWS